MIKEKTAKESAAKRHITRVDVERMLILCASALVVALALKQDEIVKSSYESPPVNIPVTVAEAPALTPAETQATVVYYQDGEGYLVPVTRQVDKTDGIAKATLALMVSSSANDLAAARLGLKTTVPEGTAIDLDIAGQKARVDLSKEALNCSNAEQEYLMVASVAQTLCEFDSVDEVSFLFDGQKRSKLTYGTDVSGVFTGANLNLESVETMADAGSATVQLYFPSASGRMLVPVTRTVFSDADVTTAILELVKGPKADSGLTAPLPNDCGLIGVNMKDGVVTINFTKEFMDAAQGENGVQSLRAILFTAAQFPGVKQVKIAVEGQEYQPPQEAQSTFLNMDTDIMTYYPGVIEID
ncbi:MAG: GerMN domain-containing protein [Clostridia bacterium]|nr:GerMN domain-containing protein [Clostridia bacterium]